MMSEESFVSMRDQEEPVVANEKVMASVQAQEVLNNTEELADEAWEEKVKRLELENIELKRQRAEDARANEKVACIFATQEQNWVSEKKSLRRQIQALFAQFRVIEAKKEENISCLNKILEEKEQEMRRKDEEMEAMISSSKDWEENMRKMEEFVEELREKLAKEAEEHSGELLKHKTALAELVSSQHQLEDEMGRNLRQLEAVKCELDEALRWKEEADGAVERLSEEIMGLRKDGDEKDKILSAMLRKSKLDTAEKHLLLKEVKVSKARRKQAELEAERLRASCEPRRRKGFRVAHSIEAGSSHDRYTCSPHERSGIHTRTLLLEYLEAESRKERELAVSVPEEDDIMMRKSYDRYSGKETDELVMINVRQLQDWIQSETEKYATLLEQRHYAEIEAFTEQMRLKDAKLEDIHWQFLSSELELKRLHSRISRLDTNLSQVKDENIKLESLLLNKEKDLQSIKDRFTSHVLNCQKNSNYWISSDFLDPQTLWAEVKISRKLKEKQQETDGSLEDSQNVEEQILLESQYEEVKNYTDMATAVATSLSPPCAHSDDLSVTTDGVPEEEIGEEKEVSVDPGHIGKPSASEQKQYFIKNSPWKMDINAMGVSYKIKRLKQQLLVVEKLTRKDSVPKTESCDKRKVDEKKQPMKGFHKLVSLLNKQAKRYQSLEEKANDLCNRMNENEQVGRSRDANERRSREQVEALGQFLGETFQLQRYMVATGQKLMEIQSRITCSFINGDVRIEKTAGFNLGQFADIVRCLLREIQRGLEVRITRMIGGIEGTMARDGILRMRS